MQLQQAYYEQKFQIAFLRAKGMEFQHLFERLMSLAYKADFMPCRPWGSAGDHKNDGFLKSERRLFQVYAPYEMTEAKAVEKITEDFEGAKVYWGRHFNKWVFAHNAVGGLPPHVQKLMFDFEDATPGFKLEPWCLEEFLLVFRKLTPDDLQSWFGCAPTEATISRLGFDDLQPVLERIASRPELPPGKVRDVPMGKIEANALSESVETLLKAGMKKAPLVMDFFNKWHDETLGERVAVAFRAKYQELRLQFCPGSVFTELQVWAGGGQVGLAEHQMAVLAVIAYFFDSCDIFEEPRKDAQ